MQYFKCYLLGKPFTVRTDHAALKWIQSFKEPEGQIARWIEQLQQYEFSTQHRSGKVHLNADGLSRHPCRQCKLKHSTESEGKMVSALLIQGCNWALSLSPFEETTNSRSNYFPGIKVDRKRKTIKPRKPFRHFGRSSGSICK